MYNVIQGLLGIAILLTVFLVLLLANERTGKDMLGFKIVFRTEDYEFKSGTFTRKEQLSENELKEVLQNGLTISMAKLDAEDIQEFYVIATDGESIQFYELNPSDVWPSKNYRINFLKKYVEG